MIRTISLAILAFAIGTVSAAAQGTKDAPNGTQQSSGARNGAATNSSSDAMGGAFRGTGTPTYGTSPGMGSQNQQKRN